MSSKIDIDGLREMGGKVAADIRKSTAPAVKAARKTANDLRVRLGFGPGVYELSLAEARDGGGVTLYGENIYSTTIKMGDGRLIETLSGSDLAALRLEAEEWVRDVGSTFVWKN